MASRVVFVDNLLMEHKASGDFVYLQPHLGLISLIAVVRQNNYEGVLYDPKIDVSRGRLALDGSLYKEIAGRILAHKPDVVGFTSLGCNFICTLKVANYIREMRPNLPILLGGPHATILDREILSRFRQFDVIVRNEAELTILPLLNALSSGKFGTIDGISYRRGGEVISNPGEPLIADLDSLPWPAFESYPMTELELKFLRIEAGRGCPFKCSFCSTASFFGRKYRLKSPQRICAEMDHLRTTYGVSHFSLTHDLFTVNRTKVIEFCDHIRGKGFTWTCSARMDCVDEELLSSMKSAGCRSLYYGVETGSKRMQKVISKNLDLALFHPTLEWTNNLGMAATASFITGFPSEEQRDQDDTLDLLGSCFFRDQDLVTAQLHLLTPEPGTALSQAFQGSLGYDGHVTDFNFPTLEVDDASTMKSEPQIFLNHHFYPTLIPRSQHIFVTLMYLELYSLGFGVLRHLLGLYNNRLSQLTRSMWKWAEGARADWRGDGAGFLEQFMKEQWGREHYLTSVVIYTVTGNRLRRTQQHTARREPNPHKERDGCHQDARYCMSPKTALLREVHDCPQIIELLRSSTTLDASKMQALFVRRGDYILSLDPDKDAITNFALEEGFADICDFISLPRSGAELRSFLRASHLDYKTCIAFLRQLIQLSLVQQGSTDREESQARRTLTTSKKQARPHDCARS